MSKTDIQKIDQELKEQQMASLKYLRKTMVPNIKYYLRDCMNSDDPVALKNLRAELERSIHRIDVITIQHFARNLVRRFLLKPEVPDGQS